MKLIAGCIISAPSGLLRGRPDGMVVVCYLVRSSNSPTRQTRFRRVRARTYASRPSEHSSACPLLPGLKDKRVLFIPAIGATGIVMLITFDVRGARRSAESSFNHQYTAASIAVFGIALLATWYSTIIIYYKLRVGRPPEANFARGRPESVRPDCAGDDTK